MHIHTTFVFYKILNKRKLFCAEDHVESQNISPRKTINKRYSCTNHLSLNIISHRNKIISQEVRI